MDYKELTSKALEILVEKAKEAATLDPDSIEYRVAVEELSDCTFLLAGDFSPEDVEKVKDSTTSGELYDLLTGRPTETEGEAPKAAGPEHRIIVTVEEHISGEFPVNATDTGEAMQMVEDAYNAGDLVVAPAPPTARLMQARDTVTGEVTEWAEF